MSRPSVRCLIHGVRSAFKPKSLSFNTGIDLSLTLENSIGPKGISPTAADLVDLAATIFQVDRHITSWRGTNPPERIQLRMKLRRPNAWSADSIQALKDTLHLLGNSIWEIEFERGLEAQVPDHQKEETRAIDRVALFSGGVDSTCGAITLRKSIEKTQLVSFYTRQKTLQGSLACRLGFDTPVQWRMKWGRSPGRGKAFFFRSFLFLALAGAVAESWNAKTIFQFENGILATAIPPISSWMMTKHAHPLLHKNMTKLLGGLFGGEWEIRNPFLTLTKRECVEQAMVSMDDNEVVEVLKNTETCWFQNSNRIYGGMKRPGMPCGVCVPCVLRRTAIPDEKYQYNLLVNRVRNDEHKGEAFRAYFVFLSQFLDADMPASKFYVRLPPAGRRLIDDGGGLTLSELHKLFRTFANEFMNTFSVHQEK